LDNNNILQYAGPTFEYNVAGPTVVPQVIDNGDPGYSTTSFTEQGSVDDAFGNNQAWNNTNTDAEASYLFENLAAGRYEVFATWRQEGQTNVGDAYFAVSDGGDVVEIDQTFGPEDDILLIDDTGEYLNFQLLDEVSIYDGDLQVDITPPAGSGYVLADAVAIRATSLFVPEPSMLLLGALGMIAFAGFRRRRS